jgi:hypothetical protein
MQHINLLLAALTKQQTPHLQNGTKANLDYGLPIWGCTAASNLAVIQRYQAKTLRQITSAPWYVTNYTLHTDLRIPRQNGSTGTHRNSSHSTEATPKPCYSNNPRTATQKAIEQKMDARCKPLR